MHKEVAQQLHEAANVAATIFSKPDRPLNPGETFHVVREKPLSENTAAVLFRKSLPTSWHWPSSTTSTPTAANGGTSSSPISI